MEDDIRRFTYSLRSQSDCSCDKRATIFSPRRSLTSINHQCTVNEPIINRRVMKSAIWQRINSNGKLVCHCEEESRERQQPDRFASISTILLYLVHGMHYAYEVSLCVTHFPKSHHFSRRYESLATIVLRSMLRCILHLSASSKCQFLRFIFLLLLLLFYIFTIIIVNYSLLGKNSFAEISKKVLQLDAELKKINRPRCASSIYLHEVQ